MYAKYCTVAYFVRPEKANASERSGTLPFSCPLNATTSGTRQQGSVRGEACNLTKSTGAETESGSIQQPLQSVANQRRAVTRRPSCHEIHLAVAERHQRGSGPATAQERIYASDEFGDTKTA